MKQISLFAAPMPTSHTDSISTSRNNGKETVQLTEEPNLVKSDPQNAWGDRRKSMVWYGRNYYNRIDMQQNETNISL